MISAVAAQLRYAELRPIQMICLLVSGPDDFQIWLRADGNCHYVCCDEMCETFFTISMLVTAFPCRYKCTYTVTTCRYAN